MVLKCKNTSLLELLESRAGGSMPEVSIPPWALTPIPSRTFLIEPLEKKRKREKKGKEVAEEGEIPPSKDPEPHRGAKITKVTQRRNTVEDSGAKVLPDHCTRVPV